MSFARRMTRRPDGKLSKFGRIRRDAGRLFTGAAPTTACNEQRLQILKDWDAVCAKHRVKPEDRRGLVLFLWKNHKNLEFRKRCADSKMLSVFDRAEELRKYEARLNALKLRPESRAS